MLVGRMSLASRTTRRARCVCTHQPPTISTPKNETRVDPRRQSGVVESHLALGHLMVHEVLEALARRLRHLLELFAVGRRRRQRERVRVLHPNPAQTAEAVSNAKRSRWSQPRRMNGSCGVQQADVAGLLKVAAEPAERGALVGAGVEGGGGGHAGGGAVEDGAAGAAAGGVGRARLGDCAVALRRNGRVSA